MSFISISGLNTAIKRYGLEMRKSLYAVTFSVETAAMDLEKSDDVCYWK